MRKTCRHLADGREVIYYDILPAPERRAQDTRDLDPRPTSAELRHDPVLGAWVMYGSSRQDRTYLPAREECPLCPTRFGQETEIPEREYQVAVFENRFPALSSSTGGTVGTPPGGQGLLEWSRSAGRCEVVCYTDDHDATFAELGPERVDLVLSALADRTTELSEMKAVEQVFCFENRGREIGVTQAHPHGQIYAYPFVAPRTEKMLASAQDYRSRHGANLFDDLVKAEGLDGRRVVISTEHWTAFVPFAARWPYELHCYPNARVPDLASLGPAPRSELPAVLLDIFGRFARLFEVPAPYIAGWHQAPVRRGRDELALHLEMFTSRRANDKLKFLAGSESGLDAFANDILPETAAARLREVGQAPGVPRV